MSPKEILYENLPTREQKDLASWWRSLCSAPPNSKSPGSLPLGGGSYFYYLSKRDLAWRKKKKKNLVFVRLIVSFKFFFLISQDKYFSKNHPKENAYQILVSSLSHLKLSVMGKCNCQSELLVSVRWFKFTREAAAVQESGKMLRYHI